MLTGLLTPPNHLQALRDLEMRRKQGEISPEGKLLAWTCDRRGFSFGLGHLDLTVGCQSVAVGRSGLLFARQNPADEFSGMRRERGEGSPGWESLS